MRIGQLAEQVGTSADAIRYYERIGLLPEPARGANRYREYGPDTITDLDFIHKAQVLGLTLSDIRNVMEISAGGDPPCDHVRSLVDGHLANVERKIRELRALRTTLKTTLAKLDAAPSGISACRCAVIEYS